MKILINTTFGGYFGGFALSPEVESRLPADMPEPEDSIAYRSHPALIAAVEEIGLERAAARFAELKIVEVPDGIDCYIHDYDGSETVHETHRVWS